MARDPEPTRTGAVLRGRYELLRTIGRGGMGEVYAAEDRTLHRRVAIKLLRDGETDPHALERFRREALAAAGLASPHIAPVLDFAVAEGNEPPFIVMELLDGEGLDALLRRECLLPIDRAIEIALQVASALARAHGAGIVHRDIKPENIFLVRSALGDIVKVLDFGIAKVAGARGLTKDDQVVGTVEYMSPEQATMRPELGPASDVWSLGVVLYRMISGQLPHANPGVNDILAGLYAGKLVPLASRIGGVESEVLAVVDRALAIDPHERYADGSELLAALQSLRGTAQARTVQLRPAPISDELPDSTGRTHARDDGIATRNERPSARPASRARMRRFPWLTIAVAILAVAAIAFIVTRDPRAGSPIDRSATPPDDGSPSPDVRDPVAIVATEPGDASISSRDPTVDAGISGLQPRPRVNNAKPGRVCTKPSECPRYACVCKNGGWQVRDCREGRCVTEAACATSCENTGGWTQRWMVVNPVISADCAASPACRTTGECVARRNDPKYNGGDLQCVKSCRDLLACSADGRCVDLGGDSLDCVAGNAADCVASEACQTRGHCGIEGDTCRVTSSLDCQRSEVCKDGGRCTAIDGACVVGSTADCAGSRDCSNAGLCTAVGSTCVATAAGCAASKICREQGQCTLVNDRCEKR